MNSRVRRILVQRAVMGVAVWFFAYGVAGQTTGKAPVKTGLSPSKAGGKAPRRLRRRQ